MISSPTREKRKESRYSCNCSARFALFARSVFYPSQVVDFSDSGMQIRTRVPADIGASMMVQVTPTSSDRRAGADFLYPTNRTLGIGVVKWCEKSAGNEAAGYNVGLKLYSS